MKSARTQFYEAVMLKSCEQHMHGVILI